MLPHPSPVSYCRAIRYNKQAWKNIALRKRDEEASVISQMAAWFLMLVLIAVDVCAARP